MLKSCVECERFDLRNSDMAKHRLGICQIKPRWQFFSPEFERHCDSFVAAEAEKVAERRKWLNKKTEV